MKEIRGLVGLTGPMGAGKSTVTGFLREEGVHVIDADAIVKDLYEDAEFRKELSEAWTLDNVHPLKPQMAHIISHDPDQLSKLESFMEPWLDARINEAINKGLEDHPFVVLDAPLLFEGGWNSLCSYIVMVTASRKVREERIMARPGMTRLKMLVLMDRQLGENDETRDEECGWIIDTSVDTLEVVRRRCAMLVNDLRKFHS